MPSQNTQHVLTCPDCGCHRIYRYGISQDGSAQRYLCRNCGRGFQTDYKLAGFDPVIRDKVLEMYKAGSTQTHINSQLGVSFFCIRTITQGQKRGRIYPPCPYCNHDDTCKFGKHASGAQRYRCKSCKKTFSPALEDGPNQV